MAEVKIYTTPTCPWCKRAKQLFADNGVEYKDFDVASDVVARKEMIDKSSQLGVPVIDIDGEIIIGYDEPRLKKALKLEK
ncbi:MAG: glutaredoxin family protein [Dehalococcoidia bacterium]